MSVVIAGDNVNQEGLLDNGSSIALIVPNISLS